MSRNPYFKVLAISAALGALAAAGCDQSPPINRVGTNVVEKSIFEGSWYMDQTVIDVQYEAGSFPGDKASDFAGSFTGMPRIRWVIDENFLFAYRDYELILGGNGAPRERNYLGHPVAAYRITSHFDIRRTYNTVTGEEQNVVVENTTDRRWYDRRFMRVDWSTNLLPGYYGFVDNLYELLGVWRAEPAQLAILQGSDFPQSWLPRFDRMRCTGPNDTACPEYERDHAGEYDQGDLYHMSFVTQVLRSPGNVPDPFTGQPINWCLSIYNDAPTCTATVQFVRTSFLKVSPRRQYVSENWSDTRWDRHGYFRLEGLTYDRSSGPEDPQLGYTDFLNYAVNRHNIWREWFTPAPGADNSCVRDSDCTGGNACLTTNIGQICATPRPYADRSVRKIVWYTTPELPAHLVQAAHAVGGEWNATLMETVRDLQGKPRADYPATQCQSYDPGEYCYCRFEDPDGAGPMQPTLLNPTCEGTYDPFALPSATGATNPYDCYVVATDERGNELGAVGELCKRDRMTGRLLTPEACTVEADLFDPNAGRELTDASFNGWYRTRLKGTECVNEVRINTCNRASIAANGGTTDGLDCQERGDMRIKFISYVDQPGTGFLGVATMRGDPTTGEIMSGDANIGGPAMDGQRTFALNMYDLINGNFSNPEFVAGEDVRAYFENLNTVQLPNPPRIDFSVANLNGQANAVPGMQGEIDRNMQRAAQRIESLRLSGPGAAQNTYSERRRQLAHTPLEYRLTSTPEMLAFAGLDGYDPAKYHVGDALPESLLDQVSPFRTSANELLERFNQVESRAAAMGYHIPTEYDDDSVLQFVQDRVGWPRARLEFLLNRSLYRDTQVHELGHCLGLRHDFGGTADTQNYFDGYYLINERIPMPDPVAFNTDNVPGLSGTEQRAFEDAYRTAKRRRELAGIDGWMNASVMDYTPQWYERLQGAGRYDHAAISFGYGDVTEIQDNSANLAPNRLNPLNTPRVRLKYYAGGEQCSTDNDCPFSASGSRSAELLPGNTSTGLTQKCVNGTLPRPGSTVTARICSNFQNDAVALQTSSNNRWVTSNYLFCSDERATGGSQAVGTLAWCNRFDEGDSYREVVANTIESYDRSYLFTNFRRYRSGFSFGGYIFDQLIGRRLIILQNIYQNLIYQYIANPEFRTQQGPFGFYDQYLATADIFNFYARIMAQPDVGTYQINSFWNRYERSDRDPQAPGAQIRMPVGRGRYFSSVYQSGLTGIQRVERIGSFYDKLFVLQLLSVRGQGSRYTRDVPLFANFYDLFPNETEQLFNGMIRDDPAQYMPRIFCTPPPGGGPSTFPLCDPANTRVQYMDFYRGDCSTTATCRPNPADVTYNTRLHPELTVLNSGSASVLQIYAAVYGLSEFPVFYDTTFQNQLFICIEGQGDCSTPDASSVEGTDYVRYTSPRYGRTFIAWQVRPLPGQAQQTSIGFSMVKEIKDLDTILGLLRKFRGDFGGAPYSNANLTVADQAQLTALNYTIPGTTTEVDTHINQIGAPGNGRISDIESFFNQVIELQRQYGITSYLRF